MMKMRMRRRGKRRSKGREKGKEGSRERGSNGRKKKEKFFISLMDTFFLLS